MLALHEADALSVPCLWCLRAGPLNARRTAIALMKDRKNDGHCTVRPRVESFTTFGTIEPQAAGSIFMARNTTHVHFEYHQRPEHGHRHKVLWPDLISYAPRGDLLSGRCPQIPLVSACEAYVLQGSCSGSQTNPLRAEQPQARQFVTGPRMKVRGDTTNALSPK